MADASRPEPPRPRSQADQTRHQRNLAQLAADLADALERLDRAEARLQLLQERLRRYEEARPLGPEEHRRWGYRGLGSLFGRAS
ncbi:MAG: hypothetical protein JOZ99_13620 [Actinobacteria bacterium]|nr:hypothetical protein [Actinomycetota bacterium]